jgi:hypothetical protein
MEESRWGRSCWNREEGEEEEKRRREGKGRVCDVERRGRNEKGKGSYILKLVRYEVKEKKLKKKGKEEGWAKWVEGKRKKIEKKRKKEKKRKRIW